MSFRPLARRLALLLVGLGWLALAHPQAQTPPALVWEHDGIGVDYFDYVLDGAAGVSLGLPTPTGTTYSAALPTLTNGQHTLTVRACTDAINPVSTTDDVCTAAVTLQVVKL